MGSYSATTGIWTTNANGADTLLQWDSNGVTAAGSVESVLLVDFANTLSTVAIATEIVILV